MSFIVVINGPEATAGSILSLFKINGNKVPINEAIAIAANMEILVIPETNKASV